MRDENRKIRHGVFLYSLVVLLGFFLFMLLCFNKSPQEAISSIKTRIFPQIKEKDSGSFEIVDSFPQKNFGIIQRLYKDEDSLLTKNTSFLREQIISLFGISYDPRKDKPPLKSSINITEYATLKNILYEKGTFFSYDGLKVPFYKFYPKGFKKNNQYPTLILFSGHGNMSQLVSQENSYQKSAALKLAKEGFIVFTMENRGMGELSYLGDHLRIDAVARLSGGSWYGEIITDGLYLLNYIYDLQYVDKQRIGTGGVSTGGALSIFVSAIDNRVSATYVQGYFGSYRTTFGIRANHCICNNIAGILKVGDISDICSIIAPRHLLIVNGSEDTFYWQDAERAFSDVKRYYEKVNATNNVKFINPQDVGHEFSVNIAVKFFTKVLNNIDTFH